MTEEKPEENSNLWQAILNDVQKHGNPKLNPNKQIVVLGNNETGKTTMVAKLQGVEKSSQGLGLEYAYINVRDDYRDDLTRLSVWVLDGDPVHVDLLSFALNAENYQDSLIIFTVSMSQPWNIPEQLQHWTSVLADHIDKLNLDVDLRQARRKLIVKKWLDYVEPGDELDATSPMKRSSKIFGDEDVVTLPEGTLTTNFGLDVIVVVTKTDYIQTLEKELGYTDEHLDYIQGWIRKFCMQYGAALFYTSAKEDKNCDLLYKYLTHKIHNFPFHTPALVVEKDAIFIPSGWDNLKKISILYENMRSIDQDSYYLDIIQAPPTKTIRREVEVAEDEQLFLARLQQMSYGGEREKSPMVAVQPSPRKLDGSKVVNAPGGEGVLANFFNSLLSKKTGSPNVSLNKSGPASRSDAQAELDRLAKDASEC